MTDAAVITKEYEAPPVDLSEVLRYARAREADEVLLACLKEAEDAARFRLCYLRRDEGFGPYRGPVILFAATVGLGFDRLILRYGRLSPVKALWFQAIGAERIESLCDLFCEEVSRQYPSAMPRRSPGYGKLPLSLQREMFRLLEPERHIGLSLNEPGLLMTPSKSVTAVIPLDRES